MSLLRKIQTGKRGRPQKVVIMAPEGFGKSTLASLFPNPLFLDVEDSTSQLDVARIARADLPDLKSFEATLAEIIAAGIYSTVIVDTFDWLEQMAVEDVIAAADNKKITGIEDFGYGKGFTVLRERVTILLSRLDAVIAAGMHVVLLAHSIVKKFEPPDGAGPYDRYELKLSKHVGPLIKEWADMLVFGNWRTQVAERDKNESGAKFKGIGGRERVMHCNRSAAWDAKNRHGLADVEKWDIAVIEKAFRDVGAPWGTAPGNAVRGVTNVTPEAPNTASIEEDQIPGIDAELHLICGPDANAVNAYLLNAGRIKPGQTYQDVDAAFAARIKGSPAAFLKAIHKNGQEVTA